MSQALATRARTRVRPVDLAISGDRLAVAGSVLLAAVLLVRVWGTWGDLDRDTGYDVVAGVRVADGDLPYADFIYYYGPLAPALAGLAALAGGDGIGPSVALGLILTALIAAGTYAVVRLQAGPLGAFLATAIVTAVAFAPGNFSFVLPHTFAATLGTALLLGFLLAQAAAARSGRAAWFAAAGACVGLAALTKPEYAVAGAAAAGAWLAIRRLSGLATRREILLVAAPLVAIPVAVYGAFAATVPLRELIRENLYPVDTLEAGGNELLRPRAPLTLSSAVELGGRLALYAAGAAVLVLAARLLARGGNARRVVLAGVALAGLGACGAALVNPEALRHGLQFAYGWIPLGAVVGIAWLVYRNRRDADRWDVREQAALGAAVILATLAATTYAGFYLHSVNAQTAMYFAPFAVVLLARLHLGELATNREGRWLGAGWLGFLAVAGCGLALHDASAETRMVRGPGGAVAAPAAQAEPLQGAVDAILANTSPGEPILLAPYLTALYPLTERADPVPAIVVQPGSFPTATKEQAAIAGFDQAGVRLAVTSRRSLVEYGHTTLGDSFDPLLAAWLQERFIHVQTLRGPGAEPLELDVWLRR